MTRRFATPPLGEVTGADFPTPCPEAELAGLFGEEAALERRLATVRQRIADARRALAGRDGMLMLPRTELLRQRLTAANSSDAVANGAG